MFGIKTKKSAGIRVAASTHKLITRGNAARTMHDWGKAAQFYRAALNEDPGLHHIWIQLGHTANEAGLWEDAETA
ncbi:MAG: hypothetical protein EOP18_02815, partial [Rhizobiaceae bacterium]